MAHCSNPLSTMKTIIYSALCACLLSSCGGEKSGSSHSADQPGASKTTSQSIGATKPHANPPAAYTPGDSVPPMEALGEGTFSAKGLADAFQHATGLPMPDYVRPDEGAYRVWNEKDFGGRNRAGYGAYYSVPPQNVNALADLIEKAWREKYGGNPEIEISRSVCDKTYSAGVRTIHDGTIGLGLNEKYASYSFLKFTIGLDPVSGEVSLTSYRGTEDTPAEREKPDQN